MTQQISSIVKSKIGLLIYLALLMIGPMELHASVWGDEETIYQIKDVPITGSDNEELCLAFKVTQTNLVIPLSFERDGYVLGKKGNCGCDRESRCSWGGDVMESPSAGIKFLITGSPTAENYYPLTDEEIKSYQRDGFLDDPLPEFEMTFWERFWFWVLVACFIPVWLCWLGIKSLFRRNPST